MIFLTWLNFAIVNSLYWNVVLKPKQVICMEKLFLGLDVLAVFPTGYGKSLIFQLLPMLFCGEEREKGGIVPSSLTDLTSIVLVICPLNSLINDQVQKLLTTGLRVAVINIQSSECGTETDNEEIFCDVTERGEKENILRGNYNLLFAHPEALLSSKFGRGIVNSVVYQTNVCAVVIDEAHCIIEW